jgi:hypothetical protein
MRYVHGGGLVRRHLQQRGAIEVEGFADPALNVVDGALDHFVSTPVWTQLAAHYSERQCMDLVFTVGQYTQVSMILNSFGVQLDPGQTLDPDLKAF